MNQPNYRTIFKTSKNCPTAARDVLQGIFTSEVLRPSKRLWVVSPWISNFEVIDNGTGSYWALDFNWGQTHIRLRDILVRIVQNGGELMLVTRPKANREQFADGEEFAKNLREKLADCGQEHRLTTIFREDLHRKGLIGDRFYLNGSMNLTHSGVELNDESINLELDEHRVSQAMQAFEQEYIRT